MNTRDFFYRLMAYPQPLRTEVLEGLESLTHDYDQDYTSALSADLEELLNDWKYTKVVARLEAEYNENVLKPYYNALHIAEYELAMGSNGPIEWPEELAPFTPPPPFPGCYDDILIFVAPMYKYAVEVLRNHATNNQDSHTPNPSSLPPDFATERAQTIFRRLAENSYCRVDGNRYKWEKSTVLLAYCIDEVSRILELRPSNDRIPWSKFAPVFGLDKSAVDTCRNEVSKYTKKYKDKPEGWRELDILLR